MQPYEEKTFTQYFLPYRELGVVKNASVDVLINLEKEGSKAIIKVYATSLQKNARVVLEGFLNETVDLSPENVYIRNVEVGDIPFSELELTILNSNDKQLISWHSEKNDNKPTPDAAKPALLPEEITKCRSWRYSFF